MSYLHRHDIRRRFILMFTVTLLLLVSLQVFYVHTAGEEVEPGCFGVLVSLLIAALIVTAELILYLSVRNAYHVIISEFRKINENDLGYRIPDYGDSQLSPIFQVINIALKQKEDAIEKALEAQQRNYDLEIEKKQAQLEALQNQINPHFLYNTLECMRSIGIYYGIQEISQIAASMAYIFRYTTENQTFVPLRSEIQCIKEYFNIIEIRYMGRFRMELSVDEAILDIQLLRMSLQPIVENAVYHGLEGKSGEGCLRVLGEKREKQIRIEVSDNGSGMTEEELASLRKRLEYQKQREEKKIVPASASYEPSGTIGLPNLYRRMLLAYGDSCTFEIESAPGEGTSVILQFPDIPSFTA